MKVFDFDNTIYDGESPADFLLFCASKKKELVVYVPLVIYSLILYKLQLLSNEKICEYISRVSNLLINSKDDADTLVTEFWQKNENKLKKQYLDIIEKDDVIISGAPRILLEGIGEKINTENIICTEFNIETGSIEFSCIKENKVKAFLEKYPDSIIDDLYTDSKNDKPLMKYAKRTHIIKNNHEK